MDFPSRLKEALADAQMTQAELARALSTSKQVVSSYCTGEALPSIARLAEIAKCVGKTMDWFASPPKRVRKRKAAA